MTVTPVPLRRRGGGGPRMVAVLLVACLLIPLAALGLVIETGPRVTVTAPPDAAASLRLRDLAERMQPLIDTGGRGAGPALHASEAEINAALGALARLHPGVAGEVTIRGARLQATLALGRSPLPRGFWLNLRATLAADAGGTVIESLHVGRLPLPPALMAPLAYRVLDRVLGAGAGGRLEGMVAALHIGPDGMSLPAGAVPVDGGGWMARLAARLRAMVTGTTTPARIEAHLQALHRTGPGPDGSLLPFLAATAAATAAAALPAGADPTAEMRAAIFALALYCGDPRFGLALGVPLPAAMQGAANRCASATLAGRGDLARHFALSAGIRAAATEGAVRGLGELKELLDSNPAGTGFGFDDIAANLAGARFAATLLDAPADAPAQGRAAPATESEILPRIDDLPAGLEAATFEARFRDIDSPAYAARIEAITARIDALPFHAPALP